MSRLPIVLASSSPYRRALLARLQLPFSTDHPAIDETALAGESPLQLSRRLAQSKARAIADRHPAALIIGSDQTVELDGIALGKPGHAAAAIEQLTAMNGRRVAFHTGLCLLNSARDRIQLDVETTHVTLRALSAPEIADYVDRDQPFDCAGSFRCEALGIALFDRIEGRDPNTLIGLPLIRLIDMLRGEGLFVLGG